MSFDKAIAKVNENTQNCTDFHDLAEPHEVFKKKLDVDVTPQLKVLDFYRGRMSERQRDMSEHSHGDQYEYIPEKSKHRKSLEKEGKGGLRYEIELTDLFKNFKQGHVCFVGPAGSGKTTLMKATARKFLQGKYLQGIIKMVQYIRCERFKANKKVTAAELIFDNTGLTREEIKLVIEFAKTHSKEVLFMLDSLDTLQYTVRDYEIITLDEPAYPEVIIWNLLSGNLISGCLVITSSRGHSINNYQGGIVPDIVIALAGLTTESIKEIIVGYKGIEEAEETMEYLKIKAPILMLLCTTPVMLVYTLIGLKVKSDFEPNTMTGIMILVMQSIIRSSHTHQDTILEILAKLKKLSYIGTVERRVLFTENDFRNVDLKPEEATDLAILAPEEIYKELLGEIHLRFQHQSIQEMLASFYILQMDLESFMKFVKDQLNTGHFVFIRSIICGFLLNHKVFEAAKILLGEVTDLDEKRATLKKSLQSQLQSHLYNSLELFTALNEAKDGMIDIVSVPQQDIIIINHYISISDAHVIGSVVFYSSSVSMEFYDCDLNSSSLQTIASALEGSKVKIVVFGLRGNTNMGVEGLSSVGQILSNQLRVEWLHLSFCKLSPNQLQALKSSLGYTKIVRLTLNEKRIASQEDIVAVANLLPNVTMALELFLWEIEDENEEILQDHLDKLGTQLSIYLDRKKLMSKKKIVSAETVALQKSVTDTSVTLSPKKAISHTTSTVHTEEDVSVKSELEVFGDKISTRPKPLSMIKEIKKLEKGIAEQLAKPAKYKFKITPEGEKIELPDVTINIPEGAIDEDRYLEIEISRQNHDFPADTMAIAPVLQFKPSMAFKKPVSISLRTWCSAIDGHLAVTILRKMSSGMWVRVQNSTLGQKNQVNFELMHFCKYGITVPDKPEKICHIINGVYMNKWGQIVSIICKTKDILKETEATLKSEGYVNAVVIPFEQILEMKTFVRARIEVTTPTGVIAHPFNPKERIPVNEDFLRKDLSTIYFEVDPGDFTGLIKGRYIFTKRDIDDFAQPLRVKWPFESSE